MIRKSLLLILSAVLMCTLFAADMKTDNIDTPDARSNWCSPDAILKGPFKGDLTLLSEDFESGMMPAGWRDSTINGVVRWEVVDTSSNMFPPNYGTYYACVDPYSAGYTSATTEHLYSPAVNSAGLDSIILIYDYSMQDYAGNGDFYVYIVTYDGSVTTQLIRSISTDQIGTDTLNLSSYLPADSIQVRFTYSMTATTAWGAAVDNVQILARANNDFDLAMLSVIEPPEVLLPPAPFQPEVSLANTGVNDIPDVWVYCLISDSSGNIYTDSTFIDTVFIGDTLNTLFSTFTPDYIKDYSMEVYLEADLDSVASNNTLTHDFRTYDIEVGILDINPASGTYDYGTTLPLWATYVNNATQATPFTAICHLYDSTGILIYMDSVDISDIAPAESLTVNFKYFTDILPEGDYNTKFYCEANHDYDSINDMMQSLFTIIPEAGTWENITGTALMPTQWPGVCQDESSIWLIGGLASSVAQTYIQRYDTINGWTYETDLPLALFSQACAIIDSKLYVIGGCDGSFITYDSVFIYDIAARTWSRGTNYPERLGGMAGGVYNNKMYLVGGLIDGAFNTAAPTYCYDPSADTAGGTPWTKMTSNPRESGGDGLELGTNFYGNPQSVNAPIICGGAYEGTHTYYRYEPDADTAGGTPWTDITYFPDDNIGAKTPLVMWDNNYAYIVGGDVYGAWGGYYPGWTYAYEFSSGNWTDMEILQYTGLEGSGGGILGDYLYSAGGTIGSGAIDPAPFERTYKMEAVPVDVFEITYTYPINRQINAPVDEEIIVAFSQPVDTSMGFNYTVTPDPGMLTHIWNSNFDTLTIFHDLLDADETYYVEILNVYDTLGNALISGPIPNPFGFSTGMTGINQKRGYVFTLSAQNDMGSTTVTFNYTLPSSGDMIIDIYNITGSRIKSLTVKDQAPGYHSVSWNADSDISSGVYLYRAVYEDKSITGRIAIIK